MSEFNETNEERTKNSAGHPHGPMMTFQPTPVAPFPQLLGTGKPKSVDETAEALGGVLKTAPKVEKAHKGDPFVIVDRNDLIPALRFLRDDSRFLCGVLQVVSAVDFLPKAEVAATETTPAVAAVPGRIELSYFLFSFVHRHQISVKVLLDRTNPEIESACSLFRSANWYERECMDLVGVQFLNHPNPLRILLPRDWVGHPLRRDYVFPEEYNGMKVPL